MGDVTSYATRLSRGIGAFLLTGLSAGSGVEARQTPAPLSVCGIQTSERIVAIGDIHGAYDPFVAILREAGLIDGSQRWTGGRAILVQTGDVVDRGPDSRKALDLLRRLEDEAARAGGRVYTLLGNHELMWMTGDARYISEGEYASFRSPDAERLREQYYQNVLTARRAQAEAAAEEFDEAAFRKQFMERTPLGLVELLLSFTSNGQYGEWIRSRPALVVINGTAFMHGGASPAVAPLGCQAINQQARAELQPGALDGKAPADTLLVNTDGPLWYRGLVFSEPSGEPAVTADQVTAILDGIGADRIVVGHTPAPEYRIRQRFDGRVVQIDTGMLDDTFYPGGVVSALEIAGDRLTAIYLGRREPIGAATPALTGR
jgi:hypothetical protein